MATQKIITGNVQRLQGGIVIPCNSTVATNSPVTQTNLDQINASQTIVRTTSKDGRDTNKILSAGTYANDNGTVMNIATSTIAGGVSKDVLKHMGPTQFALRRVNSMPSDSFFQVPSGIRAGYWNIYSGVFCTAPNSVTVTWSRDDAIVHPSGYAVASAEMCYSLGRVPIAKAVAPKTIF